MQQDRIIFHIDVNSAFLSWEAVYRLKILGGKQDLRLVPSAVAGDKKMRHGIILAKSIPAKKFGIQTGEMIGEALKKCPELVLVPPHYSLYEKSSKAFMDILKRFSPVVEQYSVDEAYCDMTGTIGLYGSPMAAAHLLKNTIREELGFTVNVGVSSNKLLAKMAGDFKKPDLVHSLFPEEICKKMWPLPVSDLFFVGRATARKLHTLGIYTIGDLAGTDIKILKSHLKSHGEVIWSFANGYDFSIVMPEPPKQKGYGNSITIAFDVTTAGIAKQVLLSLSETVCARLRADDVEASVLSVSLVDSDFIHSSHQCVLQNPTNITQEIWAASWRLFNEHWNGSPIRNLGIHTSRISDSENIRQIGLFDSCQYEKLSRLDAAVDKIRSRYGNDSIKRASFLNAPIYHMSGGISREKQKVNYDEVKIE